MSNDNPNPSRCFFGIGRPPQCEAPGRWAATFQGKDTGACWCDEHKIGPSPISGAGHDVRAIKRPERFRCLSVQQPWAWLLATGKKDIENRTWTAPVRGWVLLHAGKKVDQEAMVEFTRRGVLLGQGLALGAIVGAMRIDDCVTASPSAWFSGPYGFQIGAAVAFAKPVEFPGRLGFFNVPAGWTELENQLPIEALEACA